MRNLRLKHIFITSLLFTLPCLKATAQKPETVTVEQDSRFIQLLNDKRKVNSSITVNDRYKIQIFYGDNEKARKTLAEFKREFPGMDGTIVFESPTYKVWAGSFNTRIDGERMLQKVQEKYPYALLIKPNK